LSPRQSIKDPAARPFKARESVAKQTSARERDRLIYIQTHVRSPLSCIIYWFWAEVQKSIFLKFKALCALGGRQRQASVGIAAFFASPPTGYLRRILSSRNDNQQPRTLSHIRPSLIFVVNGNGACFFYTSFLFLNGPCKFLFICFLITDIK
jgi:hypothetical protein